MSHMIHGKETITKTYYDSEVKSVTLALEISALTPDRPTLMRELMEAIELITSGQSKKVELTLYGDNNDVVRLVRAWKLKEVKD